MPVAFVPNQRRLRLNDGEIGMLRPGRKCEGGAQGNVNDRRSEPSDSTSHHWCRNKGLEKLRGNKGANRAIADSSVTDQRIQDRYLWPSQSFRPGAEPETRRRNRQ